jgi:MFS transporter, AAHS family, benzoate transport protein
MSSTATSTRTIASVLVTRTPIRLVVLCAVLMLAEGYDLFTYGIAVPSLLAHPDWSMTPAYAGLIGSAGVFGMLIGSLAVGALTDRFGRRPMFFGAVILFSVGMLLCALAPSPEVLFLARVVVGLGSGGFLPTGLAYVVEASPINRRAFNTAITTSGVALGGALGAFVGVVVLPTLGYQALFGLGALPLLVLPVLAFVLPESIAWLLQKGRTDHARQLICAHKLPYEIVEAQTTDAVATKLGVFRALASLFRGGNPRATVVFWIGTALCMMLIFGTNTWIPSFMLNAGYGISSSIALLAALNGGSVVGTFIVARIADRTGPKVLILITLATCAVALALLTLQPPAVVVYLLVVLVGFGSGGTQNLINAYLAIYYKPYQRGTGVGAALGVGRIGGIIGPIYGGLILASDLGLAFNFYAFVIPAVLGFIVFLFGPRVPKTPIESLTPSH